MFKPKKPTQTDAAKGRRSTLPPLSEVAEELRHGATLREIAEPLGLADHTLATRLSYAGWGINGQPRQTTRRQPSKLMDANTPAVHYVGGGDNPTGLPVEPVHHRGGRRKFLGLDWTTSPATGPLWRLR